MPAKPRKPLKRKSSPHKTVAKKPRRKLTVKRKKAAPKASNLSKIVLSLGILVSLVSLAGIGAYLYWKPPAPAPQRRIITQPVPPAPPVPQKTVQQKKGRETPQAVATPTYEIYTPDATRPAEPKDKPAIVSPAQGPKVALIIDDLGYDMKQARNMIALDLPLTLALFPFSPHQQEIAELARARNLELMLHMPMEPLEYPRVDPGPGALLNAMTPDELVAQMIRNLDTLPQVAGINNHMGSSLTARSERMNQIFVILKKRGLFFVDSRTTTATQAPAAARLFQVPFAQRDVFLDHEPDARFVRRQVQQLIRVAQRDGHAIGIGHPYPVTQHVLRQMLPQLKAEVHIVPASQLVRPL